MKKANREIISTSKNGNDAFYRLHRMSKQCEKDDGKREAKQRYNAYGIRLIIITIIITRIIFFNIQITIANAEERKREKATFDSKRQIASYAK